MTIFKIYHICYMIYDIYYMIYDLYTCSQLSTWMALLDVAAFPVLTLSRLHPPHLMGLSACVKE